MQSETPLFESPPAEASHGRAAFMEAVKVAVWSLMGSKLRSFLTLLGIILATTTLIAVMGVIHGMDVYIAQQVTSMGSDGFRVRRVAALGQVDPKKLVELIRKNPELTHEEYEFIRDHATLLREIGMEISRGVTVRSGGEELEDVDLAGHDAQHAEHRETGAGTRAVFCRWREPAPAHGGFYRLRRQR